MGFSQPVWLLLLLVVAALAGGYVWTQLRRRRDIVRFAAFDQLEQVAPKRPGRFRHVPIAAILLGLALLIVALAGPMAMGKVPRNRATVVLVIDVSLSMRATDVAPSRLVAAQAAAKSFVNQLPASINLGLISFAGTAAVLVPPSTDREAVTRAIDALKLSESTATGEAIIAALQAIDSFSRAVPGDVEGPPPAQIVLMSDGKQTLPGPDGENEPRGAFTAAHQAATGKIPVSTIAFGTVWGAIDLSGRRIPVPVDEASMREIAAISGGQSFTATSEDQLREVYGKLREQVGYETRRIEISKPWYVAGTLAIMLGVGYALAFGRRIP